MSSPMDLSASTSTSTSFNQPTTIDPQPINPSGVTTRLQSLDSTNIIQLVMKEHRLVEQLYWQYQNTEDIKIKQQKVHMIIKELSQHAAKEEMVLYPVMKSKLSNGVSLVDHALKEHLEVKKELFEIDNLKVGVDADLDSRLKKCMDDVIHHVQEEESELLPSLQRVLTEDEINQLGKQFIAAASKAPSRPHPDAPNEGFLAEAANMSSKVVDELRDTARDLTKDFGWKPSGDSAIKGGKTLESEPNPAISMDM